MKKIEDNRRSFLKHVLVVTTVVAAGPVTLVRPANALPSKGTGETLYRESEDFKKYYKSLRSL